jgi:hypothetical protein
MGASLRRYAASLFVTADKDSRKRRGRFFGRFIWMPALAIILVAGPVTAQEKLSLDVTVPAPALPSDLFLPNGQPVDFIGVGLGQTVGDIRKILTAQNFANEDSSGVFLLDEEYYTVEIVASGPNRYPSYFIWSGPEDPAAKQSMRVEFSSPLAGQRSTNVRRFVTYNDGRGPTMDTLRTAITDKYGAPSIDQKTQMVWMWRRGQLVPNGDHDKQMTIAIETSTDVVKSVVYDLTDITGKADDRAQINEFQKSVEDAAKKLRDEHATAPKL